MPKYTHEVVAETEYLPARFNLVKCSTNTIPAHWHEYLEILYLISGELTAVVQAETYNMAPGDIIVINSKDLHMTQTYGFTTYILLQISVEQIKQYLPRFEFLHFQTLISPGPEKPDEVFFYIQEMLKIYQAQEDGYQLLFTSRLYELIYYLYKDYSSRSIPQESGFASRDLYRITRAMEWVRQHFQDSLSLDDAADFLGLSREYFCRMFKKYTGQTFLEYLNAVRTMHLYEDLKRTDDSVTLLMEKNGITNYKVFMRTFKRLYGDTPQRVRKAAQEAGSL
ncbi:AraC family transcriptional regulator [Murimonas intestini]|uniref:AraC-like DNA-binding protein n=1 Tax=Murimonas intestini TaxID=1337051 RepID=A0AB73T2E6_9FIRM|nr:AraC family transcriptional regulator [Murimonas intestini]MCR1841758.1 AraC family transcriptional regulator [Murimonas intestini]MCR1865575.1 AraC family transcriptional regulator [Murimonas intestini]MCR1883844.1 AraC family transcriptional regulator [Murimonas intestini]